MRLLQKAKDGGSNSPVDAYFLIEIKNLFSIALLKFNKGGREAFHTHAFNAYTWFLKGNLLEENEDGELYPYEKSIIPKFTPREQSHRVRAFETSWCLTLRGPWTDTWTEYVELTNKRTTLTHGREVVEEETNE